MKKLCLGLFVSCLFAAAVADNPVLRIMPLGDSITEGAGAGSTGGYRGPLWTKLVTEDHYNVDYVGSNTTNPDTTNGMDRDHEGHSTAPTAATASSRCSPHGSPPSSRPT